MKDHNARLKQWEGDVTRAPWTIGTFIGAVIWTVVNLCATVFFSVLIALFWSMDVAPRLSANTSGEARRDLTRTELLQTFFGTWWTLVGIAVWFIAIWVMTKEIFGASSSKSRWFTWFLALSCTLMLIVIWLWFAFSVWRKYAPNAA